MRTVSRYRRRLPPLQRFEFAVELNRNQWLTVHGPRVDSTFLTQVCNVVGGSDAFSLVREVNIARFAACTKVSIERISWGNWVRNLSSFIRFDLMEIKLWLICQRARSRHRGSLGVDRWRHDYSDAWRLASRFRGSTEVAYVVGRNIVRRFKRICWILCVIRGLPRVLSESICRTDFVEIECVSGL